MTALAFCVGGAWLVACTETPRPLGEDCFHDQDCASGLCVALKCTEPAPEAGVDANAGADAPFDAPADSPGDGADSAPDAPLDGPADTSAGG